MSRVEPYRVTSNGVVIEHFFSPVAAQQAAVMLSNGVVEVLVSDGTYTPVEA